MKNVGFGKSQYQRDRPGIQLLKRSDSETKAFNNTKGNNF